MKKIISLILVSIIGISIIPKTLVNEKHEVLESSISVYTKEEVDSMLAALNNNITVNTNEITNLKSELTTLKNSLSNYALRSDLSTTNSNIDDLNTIATGNTNKIATLENLFEQGNATEEDIVEGKTAIVNGKLITGNYKGSGVTLVTSFGSTNELVTTESISLSEYGLTGKKVDDFILVINSALLSTYFNTSWGSSGVYNINPTITITDDTLTVSDIAYRAWYNVNCVMDIRLVVDLYVKN